MARFSDYVGADYLPGEIYSAGLDEYQQEPQLKQAYMANKRFKFKPGENIDLFQNFLALQSNPELLFERSVKLPNTPFGNMSDYMNN